MKPVLVYLTLVGLPIVGTFGLLRAGQDLSAPISVGGTWEVRLSVPSPPSDDFRLPPGPTVLKISQSGTHLLLAFDEKTRLEGNVQGMRIYTGLADGSSSATAVSLAPTVIHLRATIDRSPATDQLQGVITFARGNLRTEVPLTASRQRDAIKPGGGY